MYPEKQVKVLAGEADGRQITYSIEPVRRILAYTKSKTYFLYRDEGNVRFIDIQSAIYC